MQTRKSNIPAQRTHSSNRNPQADLGNHKAFIDIGSIDGKSRLTSFIQPKLEINQPGDQFEQEADAVADKVVQGSMETSAIQMKCGPCEAGEETLQKMEGAGEEEEIMAKSEGGAPVASKAFESGLQNSKGGGNAMADNVRGVMENEIGADFSGINIHTNTKADQLSRSINARAFTHGSDIYFKKGAYDPGSREGKHLLAHELTHTVQQGAAEIQRVPDIQKDGPDDETAETSETYPYLGLITRQGVGFHHEPRVATDIGRDYIRPDFSKGDVVKVLGKTPDNWLKVERELNGETQVGYVDYRYIQPLNLGANGSIFWDPTTPEWVHITLTGVTPKILAADLYGDPALAGELSFDWDVATQGELTENSQLPVGLVVRIEYQHLKPELQAAYDATTTIAPRSSWGARPHLPHNPGVLEYDPNPLPLEDVYDSIAIHHAGNHGYRTMSEVQDKHMDADPPDNKADIGYHYGIDLQGNIYEGRPIDIKGAHLSGSRSAGRGNTGVIGIVLLADLDVSNSGLKWYQRDDSNDSLTSPMETSLLQLIHYLKGKYPKIVFLGGHKEYNPSRFCPGDIPMGQMSSWRSSTGLTTPIPIPGT